MSGERNTQTWSVRGLRTRYTPKSRLGHGMVSMAPWLDFVLLLFMFGLIHSTQVLQPGVVVSLPEAPFSQGSGTELVAVVLAVSNSDTGGSHAMVFFDDERFLVEEAGQMNAFAMALSDRHLDHPESPLVLQADQGIPQGMIVSIINVAAGVGVKQVNVAVRPQ